MRKLSDQEIKSLYESEYSKVPDVWDRVEKKIKDQENAGTVISGKASEDDSEDGTLQFKPIGKKRAWKLVASLAACFVILFAYTVQNGTISFNDNKSSGFFENADETPATESAGGEYAEDSVGAEPGTMAAVESDDMQGEPDDNLQTNATGEEQRDVASKGDIAMLNIHGRCYVYNAELSVEVQLLSEMEYLGEVSSFDGGASAEEDFTITGMELSGSVYESSSGVIYVLETDTNKVYGFE